MSARKAINLSQVANNRSFRGLAVWILPWLVHCVCIGLTWLVGAIALGSFLLMIGLNLKGRTVGVTRVEQVFGLYCLFTFLGGMIAALGIWSVAGFIEVRHDAAIGRDLVDLQAQCRALGDSQPVPTPGRTLLFQLHGSLDGTSLMHRKLAEGVAGRSSRVNRLLRGSLRGGWGSDVLVFGVLGPPHPVSDRVPNEVIDVQVIRWPQRAAIGQYQIAVDHSDPLAGLKLGEYVSGDEASLARWVNELPARPLGDRQRLLEESSRSVTVGAGAQP